MLLLAVGSRKVRSLFTNDWSYGVMVSTLDFESSDPGSNPGRTSFSWLDSRMLNSEKVGVFVTEGELVWPSAGLMV